MICGHISVSPNTVALADVGEEARDEQIEMTVHGGDLCRLVGQDSDLGGGDSPSGAIITVLAEVHGQVRRALVLRVWRRKRE